METLLAFEDQKLLVDLLDKTQRLVRLDRRQAFIVDILHLNPTESSFPLDIATPHDFAVLLVYQLAISGNGQALLSIIEALKGDLSGAHAKELSYLENKLTHLPELDVSLQPDSEESKPAQAFRVLEEVIQGSGLTAAVEFRTVFSGASEQLEMVADYKEVHDQLHQLQFRCYDRLLRIAKNFPKQQAARDAIRDYYEDLQEIVTTLQTIAKRKAFSTNETPWLPKVEQARDTLAEAITASDAGKLAHAMELIRVILRLYPPNLNARMIASAQALRLSALVHAMVLLHDRMKDINLETEKRRQFEDGVNALASLNYDLQVLIPEHNHWQSIDIELRSIEENMPKKVEKFVSSWGLLKEMTDILYGDKTEPWARALQEDSSKLDNALTTKDLNSIRLNFQSLRTRAGRRFFDVDGTLKKKCTEVRRVAEPLAGVLRIIT